jgi:hypothetical protein
MTDKQTIVHAWGKIEWSAVVGLIGLLITIAGFLIRNESRLTKVETEVETIIEMKQRIYRLETKAFPQPQRQDQ